MIISTVILAAILTVIVVITGLFIGLGILHALIEEIREMMR